MEFPGRGLNPWCVNQEECRANRVVVRSVSNKKPSGNRFPGGLHKVVTPVVCKGGLRKPVWAITAPPGCLTKAQATLTDSPDSNPWKSVFQAFAVVSKTQLLEYRRVLPDRMVKGTCIALLLVVRVSTSDRVPRESKPVVPGHALC